MSRAVNTRTRTERPFVPYRDRVEIHRSSHRSTEVLSSSPGIHSPASRTVTCMERTFADHAELDGIAVDLPGTDDDQRSR